MPWGRLHPYGVGRDELRGERGGLRVLTRRGQGPAPGREGDRRERPTSLHTSTFPNTTCNPSKKLSPMTMTVAPPVVQPSPGLMALMQGVAAGRQERSQVRGPCQGGDWGWLGPRQRGWPGGPDLRRGPGGAPCGHAWSCCAQTCCRTRPARVHPRSPSWTPPPVGRAKASLAGASSKGLLRGTGNLRPVAGYWSSGSPAWGRASAPLELSWWKGDQPG